MKQNGSEETRIVAYFTQRAWSSLSYIELLDNKNSDFDLNISYQQQLTQERVHWVQMGYYRIPYNSFGIW